jgi:flagellar motor protein MotB
VEANRLSTSGMGEGSPVAGNDTATGRQQNRRVEVIISNAATASR